MNMKLSLGSKPGGGGLQENKNRPSASSTRNAFGSSAGSTASTKGKTKKISAFGDDDGDEDEVDANKEDGMPGPSRSSTSSTSKQSTKKPPHIPIPTATSNNSRILAKLHSEAQSIDPTIFSYDEVYDSMKSAQQAAIEARKAAKEAEGDAPKYVSGLLKAAEVRKKDRIRAEDKLIEREREKEGDEFGDKDAFVTAAYKEQQEELRRLEEEEQLKEGEFPKKKAPSHYFCQLAEKLACSLAMRVSILRGVTEKRRITHLTDISLESLFYLPSSPLQYRSLLSSAKKNTPMTIPFLHVYRTSCKETRWNV